VGGFFGNPDAELLTRWYQLGAYYPFFRGHAHLETNRREPWLFGEEATGRIRAAIRARYALLPYIYTLFRAANTEGAVLAAPGTRWQTDRRPLPGAVEGTRWQTDRRLLGEAGGGDALADRQTPARRCGGLCVPAECSSQACSWPACACSAALPRILEGALCCASSLLRGFRELVKLPTAAVQGFEQPPSILMENRLWLVRVEDGTEKSGIHSGMAGRRPRPAALNAGARHGRRAWVAGLPVMRPLWFEFPGDKETFATEDEFMLGPALLIAPVLEQGAAKRDVYLPPAAKWYSAETGAHASSLDPRPWTLNKWPHQYPRP
jgi:Glycosyl hydrolases family 31